MLKWTRLACHDFADNRVRLQLFVLAYSLRQLSAAIGLADEGRLWRPDSAETPGEGAVEE